MQRDATILIIDDEPANLEFLRHVLGPEDYARLVEMTDADEALRRFDEIRPDLILLDLMMPGCDGFSFMERLAEHLRGDEYLPVLVATADTSTETRRRALSAGARDFLTKPLSPADVRLRVRNLLETRFLHEELRRTNGLLEQRVTERTRELVEARVEILDRLARAAEFRDDDTGQHTQRVGRVAARLAKRLGWEADRVELLRRSAPLHDVGKIGVPDSILLKEGPLTPGERRLMERHAVIGAEILGGSRVPLLKLAEEIALSHHERWDGLGYPNGLSAERIPASGRIVAVADVFDSLTHERPYKDAWSVRDALAEIEANAGTQFDPRVVEAMLRIVPELGLDGSGAGEDQEAEAGAQLDPAATDPMAARVRELERERDELARELRNLRRTVARRDARISQLNTPAEAG
ncbi:MAG TPA: HD domain-containing phosphohydrolase [Longimicrobiales bacterium]|nr:HD domain-containing phosphohydrolase [Longimicrobiales bacterium]